MRNAQCVMNYDNEIFSSRRIDFHAHAILPSYIDALKRLHIDAAAEEGFPLPKWSVENHLQFMADAGIDFTILSPATPHISDCKSARAINEDFAQLCRRFPEKFGFAATLPLPNVEGSIEEFHYATEKLGALGVKVASNSDGVYLGDKRLEPIFAALNEKNSLVIIHPSPAKFLPREKNFRRGTFTTRLDGKNLRRQREKFTGGLNREKNFFADVGSDFHAYGNR